MKKIFILLILVTIVFLLSIQCTKYKDNPVGSDFFQRENWGSEIYSLFLSAPSDTFYQTPVYSYLSSYLHLGGYNGNMSRSLIKFSMIDVPDTITVDSAIVTLYVNNVLGSAELPFIPTVRQITGSWETSEITWDNFESSNITENALTFTETLADTDSVLFTLPPTLIQSWIDTTDQTENNGILLTYTSLDTGSLVQYYSSNAYEAVYPKLTLFYMEDTTQMVKDVFPAKDTYISNSQQTPDKDRLWIANSIAFRSLLYFNIDTIPANATINKATLILHADTSQSFPNNDNPFDVDCFPISDTSWSIPQVSVDSSFFASGEIWGTLEENTDILRMNITKIVEFWIYEILDVNAGILLSGKFEEDNTLQRAFYSTTADSALRPYLEIFYSTPPSSNM